MSKRLQVVFEEAEYDEVLRAAQEEGMTVSLWVRQSLRAARRERSGGSVEKRLAAVRSAARHDFPSGEMDQMLEEIERGYLKP